ncbi:MAG: hypothetical protein Q7T20_19770 [Saprospiraceae bacterium]|nr:hypothetical protein [Saprospiraceae bacterium]
MKSLLILIIISALLFSSCKTKQPFVALNDDIVPILCGTFETSDDKSLLSSLTLRDWNSAEFITPFDRLARITEETPSNKPVRPASRYFIGGDTLYIEMDKGYLCYKIKNENTLLGVGLWVNKQKLIRRQEKRTTCSKTHAPTADEKTWLRQSRLYYQAYYSNNYVTAIPLLERICEEGYGPACMTLGLHDIKIMQNQEKGLAMLEKACNMGYFGNYACFRLADVLSDLGKEEAAMIAYQKACDGGHAVGCMVVSLMSVIKK